METKSVKSYHLSIFNFFPIYILLLFPFPSKYIGYSAALYIVDFILMGFMIFVIVLKKYSIPRNNSFHLILSFFLLNIMGIVNISLKGNVMSLRLFTEVVRTIELLVVYTYFYNLFKRIKIKGLDIDKLILRNIIIVTIIIFSISFIELFNFPGKDILISLYEMNKSGNFFLFYNRIVSTFRNPNFYGLWLSIILLFFYTMDLKSMSKSILMLLGGLFLFYTGSRTSWVVFVVSFMAIQLVFLIFRKIRINLKIAPFVAVGLLLFFLFFIQSGLFYSVRFRFDLNAIMTIGGRTDIWKTLIEKIIPNPIFGVGIEKSFDLIFDNLYLQYLYFYGLIGLILLTFFLLRNFLLNIRYLSKFGTRDKFLVFYLGLQIIFILSGFSVQIFDVLQISFFYVMGLAYLDVMNFFEKT